MIFRNSIKSILRTPVKTFLSIILIAVVTAFLYLCINTWASSTAILRDCEENYTTIVTMEYLEDYGSSEGFKSEAMLEDIAAIDFDAIAENENVILWQPSDVVLGSAEGYISSSRDSEFSNYCVFIVTGLRQYAENSPYYGKLVESLYSFYSYGNGVFIENRTEDFGFEPDPNATYVIHVLNNRGSTNGFSISITPFYSWAAQQAGVDCASVKPIMQIESAEALHAQEDNIYSTIAKYYSARNNALKVSRIKELGQLEEFHQNYLIPISGRLFTRQESEEGKKLCVISETIATDRELEVGDKLTISFPDNEGSTMYEWGDKMSRKETYTVVGIVNYHEEFYQNVYTTSSSDSARPVNYLYDLGQATIKNGTVDRFLSDIKLFLSNRVYIVVYDQGYQATADALRIIQNAAIALSFIAFVVTLSVLSFFSYLYTNAQQETVEIMRSFGGKKNEVRLYLMVGSSLILLIAITAGIFMGMTFAENLIKSAYEFVSELQVVDTRYSDGFRGIVREFKPVTSLSYPLAFTAGAGVFIISLVLCLYFAQRTVTGRLITARARVQIPRAPRKSSVALSGALRHATLSIRRGGVRSLLVPVLCAATVLFVSSLQSTLASYSTAQEALYENTKFSGYCAQMNGKFSDRLVIKNNLAKRLVNLEQLNDIVYTYSFNYSYLGIPIHKDGSPGKVKPLPMPQDNYELEILRDTLMAGPSILFTDSVRGAPEFYFGDFHADFMQEWEESRFLSREWETLPCIVSSQFMSDNAIEPGDTIRVYTLDYFLGMRLFTEIDMLVVGSFTRMANQNNIYCPMSLGALNHTKSTLKDIRDHHKIRTGEYIYAARDFVMYEPIHFTPQQIVDVMLDNSYISALTFKIEDPRRLDEIKDVLEEAGFSGPAMPNDIRICVVIEDAQFNEALSSLVQRRKYLEILYPVLLGLVCILGFITGFLAVNSRREDIALMRGMGTPKRQIFATIFGEQLLLLLFGMLPAMSAWSVLKGPEQLATPGVYAFFICYILSAMLCIIMQISKSAFSILSEKE